MSITGVYRLELDEPRRSAKGPFVFKERDSSLKPLVLLSLTYRTSPLPNMSTIEQRSLEELLSELKKCLETVLLPATHQCYDERLDAELKQLGKNVYEDVSAIVECLDPHNPNPWKFDTEDVTKASYFLLIHLEWMMIDTLLKSQPHTMARENDCIVDKFLEELKNQGGDRTSLVNAVDKARQAYTVVKEKFDSCAIDRPELSSDKWTEAYDKFVPPETVQPSDSATSRPTISNMSDIKYKFAKFVLQDRWSPRSDLFSVEWSEKENARLNSFDPDMRSEIEWRGRQAVIESDVLSMLLQGDLDLLSRLMNEVEADYQSLHTSGVSNASVT